MGRPKRKGLVQNVSFRVRIERYTQIVKKFGQETDRTESQAFHRMMKDAIDSCELSSDDWDLVVAEKNRLDKQVDPQGGYEIEDGEPESGYLAAKCDEIVSSVPSAVLESLSRSYSGGDDMFKDAFSDVFSKAVMSCSRWNDLMKTVLSAGLVRVDGEWRTVKPKEKEV